MNKSIPELSVDTRLLYQRLIKLQPGEAVTYDELSALIGADVRVKRRSNLYSAMRKALSDHVVCSAVIKYGIKRLQDDEIAGLGDGVVDRIHGAAGRAVKKLSCVSDFDALSNDNKVKHNAAMSMVGAIALATKPSRVEKVTAAVRTAQSQLPVAKTLELFK